MLGCGVRAVANDRMPSPTTFESPRAPDPKLSEFTNVSMPCRTSRHRRLPLQATYRVNTALPRASCIMLTTEAFARNSRSSSRTASYNAQVICTHFRFRLFVGSLPVRSESQTSWNSWTGGAPQRSTQPTAAAFARLWPALRACRHTQCACIMLPLIFMVDHRDVAGAWLRHVIHPIPQGFCESGAPASHGHF